MTTLQPDKTRSPILIFLLGLILGMWGRWFMHFIYVPAIVVAYFLGRHFA